MRRHKGREPGTFISCPQRRATWVQPICLAARAGNSALRSGLAVKKAEATSSMSIPFASTIAPRSSVVAARIASRVLALTVVAPRTPRVSMTTSPKPAPPRRGRADSLTRAKCSGPRAATIRTAGRPRPVVGSRAALDGSSSPAGNHLRISLDLPYSLRRIGTVDLVNDSTADDGGVRDAGHRTEVLGLRYTKSYRNWQGGAGANAVDERGKPGRQLLAGAGDACHAHAVHEAGGEPGDRARSGRPYWWGRAGRSGPVRAGGRRPAEGATPPAAGPRR